MPIQCVCLHTRITYIIIAIKLVQKVGWLVLGVLDRLKQCNRNTKLNKCVTYLYGYQSVYIDYI